MNIYFVIICFVNIFYIEFLLFNLSKNSHIFIILLFIAKSKCFLIFFQATRQDLNLQSLAHCQRFHQFSTSESPPCFTTTCLSASFSIIYHMFSDILTQRNVGLVGFEPTTSTLSVWYSNQLSYRPLKDISYINALEMPRLRNLRLPMAV